MGFDHTKEFSVLKCCRHIPGIELNPQTRMKHCVDDGTWYVVKVALFDEGKEMVSNEAFIYDHLIQLQGECIPGMFGLFSCEYCDAIIMEFVGHSQWYVFTCNRSLHLTLIYSDTASFKISVVSLKMEFSMVIFKLLT
jgi:hypothetical protein